MTMYAENKLSSVCKQYAYIKAHAVKTKQKLVSCAKEYLYLFLKYYIYNKYSD